MKLSKITFIIFAWMFLSPGISPWAAGSSMVAEDLVQSAKKYYRQGEYPKALHQFSKALLVDPKNEEAKEYLQKMGAPQGIYGSNVGTANRVGELTQKVREYEEHIGKLQEENSGTTQQNQQLAQQMAALEQSIQEEERKEQEMRQKMAQEMTNIQESARQQKADAEGIIVQQEKLLDRKAREIARLNTDLYDFKGRLVEQTVVIKEQDKKFEETVGDLKQHIKMSEHLWRKNKIDYENDIRVLEKQYAGLRHQTDQEEFFKKKKFMELQSALRKMKIEADYARNTSLMLDYKLVDRERRLAAKNRKVAELKESILGLDEEVASLQSRLRVQQASFLPSQPASVSDERQEEFMKKQDALIMQLKEELAQAGRRIQSLSSESTPENKSIIAGLKKQLASMQGRLDATQDQLEQKTSAYETLEKRLTDTKKRLDLVEEMMEGKEREIADLEDQLNQILLGIEE